MISKSQELAIKQFNVQVWSESGKLLLHSVDAPHHLYQMVKKVLQIRLSMAPDGVPSLRIILARV